MPGTEVARKQHTLGGAAGIALLAFALVYRFFPGVLHMQPLPVPSVTTNMPGQHAMATVSTTWSAVKALPAVTVPANAGAAIESGTSFADAVSMGPPVATTKVVAALLRKARETEQKGALFEPKDANAIAMYRQVLVAAPNNADAENALERIGGALRDLSLIHISEPTRQAEISYAVFCLK